MRSKPFYRLERDGIILDSLPDYIHELKGAALLILKSQGILPDFLDGDQAKLLKNTLFDHEAIYQWVEREHLGRSDLAHELLFTKKIHRLPKAKESIAFLKICQMVFDKDQQHWKDFGYPSAENWWFSVEMSRIEHGLIADGLLDRSRFVGKAEYFNEVCSLLDDWQERFQQLSTAYARGDLDEGILTVGEYERLYPNRPITPDQILFQAAGRVAADPSEVFFREEFRRQEAIIKRSHRQVRENKALQMCGLDDSGKLIVGGKSKRGLGKKKKGFAK